MKLYCHAIKFVIFFLLEAFTVVYSQGPVGPPPTQPQNPPPTQPQNQPDGSSSNQQQQHSSNGECNCTGPYDKLRWVDTESNLGSVDTCGEHDDDDKWFQQLNYDEAFSNLRITYRYCERKESRTFDTTQTCGGDWNSQYVTRSFLEEAVCGEWKTKTIPDDVNFRPFYDNGVFENDDDPTCGCHQTDWVGCRSYCHTYTGPPEHAALAYSKPGTICFRYGYSNCDSRSVTGSLTYCDGSSQRCEGESCGVKCFPLTDTNSADIITLSFQSFGGKPAYYVEMTFNNEGVKDSRASDKDSSTNKHAL